MSIAPGVSLELILVRPGEFLMGASGNIVQQSKFPPRKVRITKPYYLGKYEITQQQWSAIMGSNPSCFLSPVNPVERFNTVECYEFIARLNKNGYGRFRLPAEAEWEFACRAGTTSAFSWGDQTSEATLYCNFADSAAGEGSIFKRFGFGWADMNARDGFETTSPVGSFKPNPAGFYDMHGNLWEICSDWYSETYLPDSPVIDPAGPETGEIHVLRGGSWGDEITNCISGSRAKQWDTRWWVMGMRVAWDPPGPLHRLVHVFRY
ncbi:MAG: formylglycine-generating enzyme family protein [Candidatus Wallbacteria bacterium]|nr:formylglycine-generating enzyme family protein [Candidatus Wallbacteria bacterium]